MVYAKYRLGWRCSAEGGRTVRELVRVSSLAWVPATVPASCVSCASALVPGCLFLRLCDFQPASLNKPVAFCGTDSLCFATLLSAGLFLHTPHVCCKLHSGLYQLYPCIWVFHTPIFYLRSNMTLNIF